MPMKDQIIELIHRGEWDEAIKLSHNLGKNEFEYVAARVTIRFGALAKETLVERLHSYRKTLQHASIAEEIRLRKKNQESIVGATISAFTLNETELLLHTACGRVFKVGAQFSQAGRFPVVDYIGEIPDDPSLRGQQGQSGSDPVPHG